MPKLMHVKSEENDSMSWSWNFVWGAKLWLLHGHSHC